MTLEHLDKSAQEFISIIVDSYVKGSKIIAEGLNPYVKQPGTTIESLLSGFLEKALSYHIFLKNDNGNIKIYYIINNDIIESDSNNKRHEKTNKYINVKRADVLYKITMLKWLYDSGHIFLIDDNCLNSFYSEMPKNAKEQYKQAGKIYKEEIIYSEIIYGFISKHYSSHIIPSPQLIDLRNKNFKTIEKRRFIWGQITSWAAILIAISIALSSPFLMSKCSHTAIEREQYESIIKAIPEPVEEVKIDSMQIDHIIRTIMNCQQATETVVFKE